MSLRKAPLTVPQILAWCDLYRDRNRDWPTKCSRPLREMRPEPWRRIDNALRLGLRGLHGGSALARFLEAKVQKAVQMLARLQEQLHKADPALLRDVLREMVDRIECWFEHVQRGKRSYQTLSQGFIYLRPDISGFRPVCPGSPGNGNVRVSSQLRKTNT